MAAPLVQRVELDAASAQRQLAQLERQLSVLNNPINVPVDIDVDGTQRAEKQMGDLRREVDQTGDEFTELGRKADASTDGILRVGTRGASAFTSLKGSIIGVGAAIAAIQGVRLLGGFAADAIQSASNLQESLSKTNVVFEEFSGEIQDFAKDAPRALGLSTAAALESTSTFGNLFVALGLTRDAAADLSPDIVQLASDLASFNNIGVQEAIEKLRSGLVGEAEPLRALGVNINEALVQAKALELGLVDVSGTVTEAGKVQARYALILEQTTTAQGDYARTATGIANTQRTLSAEFENAKTAIGEALLPAYQALLEIVPSFIAALEGLAPSIRATAVAFAEGVGDAEGFFTSLAKGARLFPTTISGLVSLGGAAVNTFQAIGGFLSLDFGAALAQTKQLTEGIGNLFEQLQLSALTEGFIAQLEGGVDPALALANALLDVTNILSDPADIQAAAEGLARISGLDASRLDDVAVKLRSTATEAGLAAGGVLSLIAGVRELNLIPPPPQRPGSRGGNQREIEQNNQIGESALDRAAALTAAAREEATAARLFEETVGDEANALEILGRAADDADTSIFALLANQANLDPVLQAAAGALSTSTLKYLEQVDAIDEVKTAIGLLPGAMDAAQAALRDSEGEIVKDLETFLDNLITTLAEREQFEVDLAILRVRGQGALADVFEAEGLGAREALADAVSDPTGAGIANATLLGQVRDAGVEIAAELEGSIAGLPVTQGLIDNIIAAAAAADSPETQAALLALAAKLQLEIPVVFGAIPTPPGFGEHGERGRGGGTGGGGGDDKFGDKFEFNYFTEPVPTTNTQRAAMEIQSIVAGTRR